MHNEERRVTVGGREVELTAKEYDILRVLSLEAGRVVTYDDLLRKVWNRHGAGGADLVRGVGYRMKKPDSG